MNLFRKNKKYFYILLIFLVVVLLVSIFIDIRGRHPTYNQVIRLNHKGEVIKWKGKIAPYSQINGIKFCIIDDEHENIDNTKVPCDWFWATSKNLDNIDNPQTNPGWNGNWVEQTLKYYQINIDRDLYNRIYIISGRVNGLDCDANFDGKCVPDIDIIDIKN